MPNKQCDGRVAGSKEGLALYDSLFWVRRRKQTGYQLHEGD